jgi:hypothetical protein
VLALGALHGIGFQLSIRLAKLFGVADCFRHRCHLWFLLNLSTLVHLGLLLAQGSLAMRYRFSLSTLATKKTAADFSACDLGCFRRSVRRCTQRHKPRIFASPLVGC